MRTHAILSGVGFILGSILISAAAPRAATTVPDRTVVLDGASGGRMSHPESCGATGCDDGNVCTEDSCNAATGQCEHVPISCNDDDPCTNDGCDPVDGCTYTPHDGNACQDPDPCWINGTCAGGYCISQPRDCNDANPCTIDSCNRANGQCVHTPKTCDDGNACTDDSCDAQTGECRFVHNTNTCTDGNACTIDACSNGSCVSTPRSCDDGKACTADSCSPSSGCGHVPTGCNDGNPCTVDDCTDSGGCTHSPGNDGGSCSNGSSCWGGETCLGGVCQGGSISDPFCYNVGGDPCSSRVCNRAPGGYCEVHVTNCDDSTSCTSDRCGYNGWCFNTLIGCADGACEVPDLRFDVNRVTLTWSAPALACGAQPADLFDYQVVRGRLSHLPTGSDPLDEYCTWNYSSRTFNDPTPPAAGEGFWYLTRAYHQESPVSAQVFTWGWQGSHGAQGAPRQTSCTGPFGPAATESESAPPSSP